MRIVSIIMLKICGVGVGIIGVGSIRGQDEDGAEGKTVRLSMVRLNVARETMHLGVQNVYVSPYEVGVLVTATMGLNDNEGNNDVQDRAKIGQGNGKGTQVVSLVSYSCIRGIENGIRHL